MSTKSMLKAVLAVVALMFSTAIAQLGTNDCNVGLSGLSSSYKTLDMVYVEGGTFTMGCSTGDNLCTSDEAKASNVTLSDYYISKYEITGAQWNAVMGSGSSDNKPKTSINWYNAVEFTCKLSELTGKKYRLATEAEFEFAARGGNNSKGYLYSGSNTANDVAWNSSSTYPEICYGTFCYTSSGAQDVGSLAANELGIHDMSGNVYEWVYDNWGNNTSGLNNSTDYTTPHSHMQKVRRGGSYDQPASESRVSARKIRSIEGKDGSIGIRLALSTTDTRPPNMTDPCDLHQPEPTGGKKGFRDERLITADDEVWNGNYGNSVLVVKENSAIMASTYAYGTNYQGEWYTLNNFSLNIVTSSGTKKYIYYLVDDYNMTLMEDGGMPSRWERKKKSDVSGASSVNAPTITSPKTPEELAPANYNIDMANPPTDGRDPRLIVGPDNTWLQDNVAGGYGGTHRYLWDFDSKDDTRFIVYDPPSYTSLARGSWYTVDNTFLRVNDNNGATYDYLYSVSSNGRTFYHISFQEYEPGDSRTFTLTDKDNVPDWDETKANGTTYNQGSSIYIPPSDDDPVPSSSSVLSSSSSSSNNNRSSSSFVAATSDLPECGSFEPSSSSNGETSILPQISMSNKVVQIKNGLNLQAMNGATVEIYGINGNLISRQNCVSGTHLVSFAHLQKGMYIVKVRIGSSVKILRMPVI